MVRAGNRRLFVLSAPSGAGKSTILALALHRSPQVEATVSHATRAPRPGEQDGVSYHFVSREAFAQMESAGAYLESFEVHGNRYGTAWAEVERIWAAGRDALCEVDVQGASAIRARFPEAISLFIVPPSLEELERRLRGRGTEDEPTVLRRLSNARSELARAPGFDYVIVNDDLDEAVEDLVAALRATPLATRRQTKVLERLGVNV